MPYTIYTISHGSHWDRIPGRDSYMYVDSQHVSHSRNTQLKEDWQEYQGFPSDHFARAKNNGYDFYITTDHSQEAGFHPTSPVSSAWVSAIRQAEDATDDHFVALTGYEHSENNGPGGRGHINVINTATYLNALEPGIDLPYLYKWLATAEPNGEGPVVATFNHPGRESYNNWSHRDARVTEVITMLEMINSNNRIHYEGFVSALDHGWKVSPVCGNDNHNLPGIESNTSRTFVLAEEKSKTAILEAMKNRRTYASLEQNLRAAYTVNGSIMGSTIDAAREFEFDITADDPDSENPGDMITKIDIVTDNGEVVQTFTPEEPSHSIQWKPVIRDEGNAYFFIRIWNASGGDAPRADASNPVAWLAPVWINR